MIDLDKNKFLEVMTGCAAAYSQSIEKPKVAIYWETLKDFSITEVSKAVSAHVRESKFFPTLAEIITYIPSAQQNKHLGADEAWTIAKQAMNQDNCACVTDQILEAMDIAWDVYSTKDENPARMAFRDAYTRIVKSSGNPVWFVSLGNDKTQAEGVALEGVRLGRLPHGAEVKYLTTPVTATVLGLIEGYVSRVDVRDDEMAKIKVLLAPEPKKKWLSDDVLIDPVYDRTNEALPSHLRDVDSSYFYAPTADKAQETKKDDQGDSDESDERKAA